LLATILISGCGGGDEPHPSTVFNSYNEINRGVFIESLTADVASQSSVSYRGIIRNETNEHVEIGYEFATNTYGTLEPLMGSCCIPLFPGESHEAYHGHGISPSYPAGDKEVKLTVYTLDSDDQQIVVDEKTEPFTILDSFGAPIEIVDYTVVVDQTEFSTDLSFIGNVVNYFSDGLIICYEFQTNIGGEYLPIGSSSCPTIKSGETINIRSGVSHSPSYPPMQYDSFFYIYAPDSYSVGSMRVIDEMNTTFTILP